MLKAFLRAAAADLSADDVKELASVCNVLANEKLKERSKADKGKKKKTVKKSLQMERGDFDGGPRRTMMGMTISCRRRGGGLRARTWGEGGATTSRRVACVWWGAGPPEVPL
eukprot:TRINITY_DN4254_c0_g1_i2.p3 TRINITY_DN4254_c0_g1~~TRINITY_DN4254_c0_g1_i2.p3  ORF type:complete len:112 (-),score=32.15 TRINITY_DN4254_c0_g1_i2:9-344(-)